SDIVVASLIGFESERVAVPLAFITPGIAPAGLRRHSAERSRYLHDHAKAGPWVEEWAGSPLHAYADTMRIAGVRAVAYAPIRSNGALIGLLAIGSSKPEAVAQLSAQLGALVDFADLAGALIGPQLGDRSSVRRRRAEIQTVIDDRAFAPV